MTRRKFFTGFFVTHVSILTSNISRSCHQKPSPIDRTFCYWHLKSSFARSRCFGESFEPWYIFGAMELDQWAITFSSKDGCFQAHRKKICHFLCQILAGTILVNEQIFKRHIGNDPSLFVHFLCPYTSKQNLSRPKRIRLKLHFIISERNLI